MNDRFEWLEDWRAPGLCRLAQAKGGEALWVLVHRNEAALLGAPFAAEESGLILDRLGAWLGERRLWVKFFSLSRLQPGLHAPLAEVARYFDRATLVFPDLWAEGRAPPALFARGLSFPYDNLWEFDLAGEPVVFMRAPYHSPTDQLVVFRGVALQPGWHLPRGPGEPVPAAEASLTERQSALRRILDFNRGYSVHSHLSARGDGGLETDFAERIAYALAAL